MPAVFDEIAGLAGRGAPARTSATVLNPKNLALLLSTGSQLGAQDLTGVPLVVTAFVFVLLGASPRSPAANKPACVAGHGDRRGPIARTGRRGVAVDPLSTVFVALVDPKRNRQSGNC